MPKRLGVLTCLTAAAPIVWLIGFAVAQAYYSLSPQPEVFPRTAAWAAAAGFALVALAAVGGILFLMTRPAPARPVSWGVLTMAAVLRVLAGVLLGVGLLIVVVVGGLTVYAVTYQPREWRSIWFEVLMPYALGFLTAGVGGVLWCLVRLAYPPPPPPPPPPPAS